MKTKIKGYSIELSTCGDFTKVWVEKGKFANSLVTLHHIGVLESNDGAEHKVKSDVIDELCDWACDNGYSLI